MRNILTRIILALVAIAAVSFWLARKYLFDKFSQKTIEIQQAPAQDSVIAQTQETAIKESNEKKDAEKTKKTENTPEKENSSQNKKAESDQGDILDGVSIIERFMKSGFEEKKERSIDTIVLHASYDALGTDPYSVEGVIREYEMYGVSAHYLIDRSGRVYQLVKDNNIAWHAGASSMPDGKMNVNQFSIGIELLYTKKEKPNSDQYESLKKLIAGLKEKYPIKNIVGHNQIAPERKDDPWNFDWKSLNR